ncbi:MAG: OFA family MFS transporter [Burkholderiales bacterium]|jgi:MFS family permease|nr:OFA family MFS transporter [Burkholderiales bacterium]
MAGLLDKENTIARPGFSRWLVPPAALAIHLSIGMAYGFSVFWLPLSKALGIKDPDHLAACAKLSFWQEVLSTTCDWKISTLSWMYTPFFVFLGLSAAVFGHWLEHNGPRKAGVVAAFCWGGGLLISAVGVQTHQVWIMWLGSGLIGGIGLGLGYISPVSTLIKWFPDKRGVATGMAIMGFGGGAMIGAPLANLLMNAFKTDTSPGVWQTFVTMGVIYFVAMMIGALGYRIPAAGWKPAGWTPPAAAATSMITSRHVHVNRAHRTPQFWLLWGVLCMNVSAGIGVIGMASPMLQEIFGGRLIDQNLPLAMLDADQKKTVAAIGAGFAALLSLFNIVGRIAWASLSDVIGRKVTYAIFFSLGFALYALSPSVSTVAIFVALFCVVLTMYGGGFATIPAYLSDMFGTQHVGAIHGRLLTAWSTAGILGPVIITQLRESQLAAGVPPDAAYHTALYVLSGLLVVGFVCNLLVRPVADHHFMSDDELAREKQLSHEKAQALAVGTHAAAGGDARPTSPALIALAWIAVGIPLAWGIWNTLLKALVLFH